MLFSELQAELSSYLPNEQIMEIARAYDVAQRAHAGQIRSSNGEAFIMHPLRVAEILAKMQMDQQSILAAILHDVIEDTEIKKEQIAKEFGDKIAEIVDGLSKLNKIEFTNSVEAQAGNLRKMMLAMTKDIRVILVKLADRLHNMRTLEGLPREKQRRIALETLELYAPISHRLGMHKIKEELEDLGFYYLYPWRYKVLHKAIKKVHGHRKDLMSTLERILYSQLQRENISVVKIASREKHVYSLYKKMRRKDLTLTEVMDVNALRIIIDNNIESCYTILGIVHNLYRPIYERFKDYIAVPKHNGYQSLHTIVLGPNGVPIEVQIRTKLMHQRAENGIAAHWLYKTQSRDLIVNEAESKARSWLQSVLDIQKNSDTSMDFMEKVKLDLYPEEVYVFTPDGDVITLPIGATVIDFAYEIDPNIGNNCVAARIDRRLMPLNTKLSSGKTIKLIVSDKGKPDPFWLKFVVTNKAKSNIEYGLKMQQITESRELGESLLRNALNNLALSFEHLEKEKIDQILKKINLDSIEQLFEEIGLGNQVPQLIAKQLTHVTNNNESGNIFAIKGTEGMVVSYSDCCKPIPGDSVIGALNTGSGIIIHKDNCKHIFSRKENPDQYIFVQWADNVVGEFFTELKIDIFNDQVGALALLANAISDCNCYISNVHIEGQDHQHITFLFTIKVSDTIHLKRISNRIKSIHFVSCVQRIE